VEGETALIAAGRLLLKSWEKEVPWKDRKEVRKKKGRGLQKKNGISGRSPIQRGNAGLKSTEGGLLCQENFKRKKCDDHKSKKKFVGKKVKNQRLPNHTRARISQRPGHLNYYGKTKT